MESENGRIRKEDIISLLKKWADGYTVIVIPVETAIHEIEQFTGIEAVDDEN